MRKWLIWLVIAVLGGSLAATLPAASGSAQEEPPDPNSVESGGWDDYPLKDPIMVSVGPGARALDPVAVALPACRTESEWCRTVQEIVQRDLTLSGFFKVLPADSYIADMTRESLNQTKWEDWFNVGSKYLVKGSLEGAGKGRFNLSLRLYDVNLRKVIEVDSQEAAVSANGLRGAVHRFVNEVIRAITGSPGMFRGRILYAAKTSDTTKGIFAMGTDGFGRSRLSPGESIDILPSQVGRDVLYTSFAAGPPAIFLNGKQISPEGHAFRGARMRPDGKMIAASVDTGQGQSDIFLMSREGKLEKNLTNHWADEVSPCWSPGGGQLVFVSNRTGAPQIYIMNGDGSGQRRLTFAGGYNSTPDLGTNGLVVFAGMDEAHSDIFVVDMEGSITRVTQEQGNNKDPAWSPDGRHIAFVSDRDGKWKVFVATADGRYQYPITDKRGSYSTLFWAH